VAYVPYLALAVLGASMFFALLSYSLRRYSMVLLETRFTDAGRPDALEWFLAHEDSMIMATSLWRLGANVGFGVLLTVHLASRAGPLEIACTAVVAIALLAAFAVAVPMAWAKYGAESVIVRTLPVLRVLRAASWPALAFLGLFDGLVRRLSGVAKTADREDELETELLSVVKEGEIEGAFEENETEMIESIIEFKDTDVAEIMTPRTDMVCLLRDMPLAAARDRVVAAGHSRIPAFQGDLDTIVGVLYAKDLLDATGKPDFDSRRVADIMRDPLFIPETKKLTELLRDFQQAGVHIAIVLDEYGGTAGLVTIEDVIEEIVGEITDEYDRNEPEGISRTSETAAEVDARTRIDEVNDELGIDLPEEEDYDTIGGFVFSKLGIIPKRGDVLQYRGLTITVLEADERRISRLGITGLDTYERRED